MLKAIRLKDCQSWEDTTIQFSMDKPNILIADNSVGKSVVFKMLKITVYPKMFSSDERKDLIRYGADCAILTCLFDDDSIGMTLVFRDRVLYRFKRQEDTSFVSYNEFPDIYREHLNIIKSDKSDNFIVNIIDTDQDINLVNTKSAGNVEILKLLAEEPTLSEVLMKINSSMAPLKETEKQLRMQQMNLESSLEGYEYTDIEALENSINKSDSLIKIIELLLNLYTLIDKISVCITDYHDYDYLLHLLDCIQLLNNVYIKFDTSYYDKKDYTKAISVIEIVDVLNTVSATLDSTQFDEIDLTLTNVIIDVCQICITLYNKFTLLDTLQEECTKNAEEITALKNKLNESGFVIQCPIKGEVLYINDECLPYNNGYT